ncbi:succinate dehydrogenase, cytochrome b556 subunit [Limoniibacter endophyticus]|nr:succinate dehydrogenase, cytochrome b556 subunit [Limoniibacter endophyticus]
MSKAAAARTRPLSPHMQIYRWPVTMAMSILHRATGIALYFGTILVVWWLLAAATSESAFAFINGFLGSWFGVLILFGYTWVLLHHMVGGIRHFIWDTGHGLRKDIASKAAWANIAISISLTVLFWIVALVLRA